MSKQNMSKQKILLSFLTISTVLILAVFYFFENFSFLISGNFSSENGKCQSNSVENIKVKLGQNQDKIKEIKQKLEIQYPNFANKNNSISETNKNSQNNAANLQKYEQNVLLEDKVFWSIDKSAKCPGNNLVRFDVANNKQKEIIKSVLGNEIEYEIWNR